MTATIFDIEEQICAIRLLELPPETMKATVPRIESTRVLECAKALAEGVAESGVMDFFSAANAPSAIIKRRSSEQVDNFTAFKLPRPAPESTQTPQSRRSQNPPPAPNCGALLFVSFQRTWLARSTPGLTASAPSCSPSSLATATPTWTPSVPPPARPSSSASRGTPM